jgi:predicted enzyme related to lactoylglutathione lyase
MKSRPAISPQVSLFLAALFLIMVLALGGLSACRTTGPASANDMPLSDSPLVGKFVWHDLIIDDVAAARRFYGGLLGWSFEKSLHPLGGDYVLINAGGRYIGGIVYLKDGAGVEYSRWLPYLSVADVDAAVSYVESAGGTPVVAPVELGDVARAAAVTDPQGAVLGLVRSRMGDPDDSQAPVAGQVIWNELLTADAAKAAVFYQSLAGLQPDTIDRRGGQYTLLKANGRERGGIMNRPDDRITPLWLTHFAVSDVDMAARRAAELGGEVLLAPTPEFREGTLAVVTDPGGAVLALHEWP